MKKVYVYGLIAIALLLNLRETQAQAQLGLYTTSISNINPAMGEEFSVLTKLINNSPTDTFSSLIDFSLANESGLINDINVFGEPQQSGTVLTLAPLQEIFLLFTVNPQPAYFTPGPDIIIVWPYVTNPTRPVLITDSARAAINIKGPTDVNEIATEPYKVFLQGDQIVIQAAGQKEMLQHVQIYSANGTLISTDTINTNEAQIKVSGLSRGMYIAEITNSAGYRKTIKFIKQ